MKYYKVKPECDNLGYATGKKGIGFLIENELYTEKQAAKIFVTRDFSECFDIVQINPKRTYYLFGARFETKLS